MTTRVQSSRRFVLIVAAAVAPTAMASEVLAQRSAVGAPVKYHGIREAAGRVVVHNGLRIMTAATSDGLVELVVSPELANELVVPRETRTIRAFYDPATVLSWVRAVDTLRAAVAGEIPFEKLTRQMVQLGRGGDAAGIWATATTQRSQPHLSLRASACRGGNVHGGGVDAAMFPTLMANLAAAASEARDAARSAPIDIMNSRTYFEHAVGCVAEPYASNLPPAYPSVPPSERRRREVLAEFVVDSTGLVDTTTVRFPDGVDARFAAPARLVLARWRFTKPTRAGIAVRQLSHWPIIFEPPLGDAPMPGCVMGAIMGVQVRPVSGVRIEPAYLAHAASNVYTWLSHPAMLGASTRFVVRRDGRLTDATIDRPPADSMRRSQFEMMMRNVPFILDPLPPTYPSEAVALEATFVPSCESPRVALVWGAPTTVTPLRDGTIELANLHPAWASKFWTREPPPSRDVVSARALSHFLDTTSALLRAADGRFPKALDRWSGSLAEVPILGYRNNVGLILGLGTQGQLHGGISCGTDDESINFRREDLPAFWRIGRDALAMRSRVPAVAEPRNRVYAESEVACAAVPVARNDPIAYPNEVQGANRSSHEALVAFTVDTLGRVERASIRVGARSDARFARAIRTSVTGWRFRAALRGGRRVRQRLHMSIVLRPPEADAVALAASPSVAADTSRTIFFRKP